MFKIDFHRSVNRALFEVKDGTITIEETCPFIGFPPYCELKAKSTLKYDIENDVFRVVNRSNNEQDTKVKVRYDTTLPLRIQPLVSGKFETALDGMLKEAFCTFVYASGFWTEVIPDAPRSCFENYPSLINEALFEGSKRSPKFLVNTLLLAYDAWMCEVINKITDAKRETKSAEEGDEP